MIDYIHNVTSEFIRIANSLSMRDWLWIAAGVVTIGAICLRGFGSRNAY